MNIISIYILFFPSHFCREWMDASCELTYFYIYQRIKQSAWFKLCTVFSQIQRLVFINLVYRHYCYFLVTIPFSIHSCKGALDTQETFVSTTQGNITRSITLCCFFMHKHIFSFRINITKLLWFSSILTNSTFGKVPNCIT